jgi:hypothetical protein
VANALQAPPHIRDIDVTAPGFQAALTQVGAILAESGLTDLFAVQVAHRHFPMAADEVLLETTDEGERVQTTRVVSRDRVDGRQAATWRFTPHGEPVAVTFCSTRDSYH